MYLNDLNLLDSERNHLVKCLLTFNEVCYALNEDEQRLLIHDDTQFYNMVTTSSNIIMCIANDTNLELTAKVRFILELAIKSEKIKRFNEGSIRAVKDYICVRLREQLQGESLMEVNLSESQIATLIKVLEYQIEDMEASKSVVMENQAKRLINDAIDDYRGIIAVLSGKGPY